MAQQFLGRYEILGELGRGGMAAVYHARDPRFKKREVAIKILPHNFLADQTFRARFEQEAETIAALEHPAIVPVYDYGEQDNQPFIVMRYMSGGSLAERLRGSPLPLAEAARIIRQLAPALDTAHAAKVIHRDLKPANILFDANDNPYLSDFGIAKIAEQTALLTGSGIIGTPAYMSPEQIHSDRPIDARSDLYALGVIVFQMLTGHIPYEADTPPKLLMMHLLNPVPNILTERPDLPAGVQRVIAQALAKDPDQRFATAAELSAALDQALQEAPDGAGEEAASAQHSAPSPRPAPIFTDSPVTAPIAPTQQKPGGGVGSRVLQTSGRIGRWTLFGVIALIALVCIGFGGLTTFVLSPMTASDWWRIRSVPVMDAADLTGVLEGNEELTESGLVAYTRQRFVVSAPEAPGGELKGLWDIEETVIPPLTLSVGGEPVSILELEETFRHSWYTSEDIHEIEEPGPGPIAANYVGSMITHDTLSWKGFRNGDVITVIGRKATSGGVIPERLYGGDRVEMENTLRSSTGGMAVLGVGCMGVGGVVLAIGVIGLLLSRRRR